ncbi:hypothetical protein OJAV_G00057640 [Oryzias javanicus]|uniref:EF-hand domain-containing protein n=1 Tax=Oryzias javanicus TaxID=123683 RepID=A0A3S2N2K2_ORYJA|nr:hypothetical protein OJAV_G00057640 [Oryzias javanicus]
MGNEASRLDEQTLLAYEEQKHLPKEEILLAYKKFDKLVPKEKKNCIDYRVPMNDILTLPELKFKPFNKRMCMVFSTSQEKDGSLNFEDFLNLLSVFRGQDNLNVQIHYAFRIFDFDGDNQLRLHDLEKLFDYLTSGTEEKHPDFELRTDMAKNFLCGRLRSFTKEELKGSWTGSS